MTKKAFLVFGILLIIIIIGSVLIYNYQKQPVPNNINNESNNINNESNQITPITQPDQECFEQREHCIYNNIPASLKYSEPNFFLWEEDLTIIYKDGQLTNETIKEFSGNLSDYLVRDNSPNRLGEVFSGDWNSYKCLSTNEAPVIIEYFHALCKGTEGSGGCGHQRRAVICKDIYFVQDFTSSYGPRLFGPFSIEN